MLQREELFGKRQIARRSLGLRCWDRGHHGRTLSNSHRRACSWAVAVHSLSPPTSRSVPVVTFDLQQKESNIIAQSPPRIDAREKIPCILSTASRSSKFSPARAPSGHVQHVSSFPTPKTFRALCNHTIQPPPPSCSGLVHLFLADCFGKFYSLDGTLLLHAEHYLQENSVASLCSSESATAQTSEARRQGRGYRQYCTSE